MSAGCTTTCGCTCHDNPLVALEALGIDWRKAKLTLTEMGLVAALAPVATVRTYGWIWSRLHPDETYINASATWHNFTVHAARLRVKLRPYGLTVVSIPTIGMSLESAGSRRTRNDAVRDIVGDFLQDADRQRLAIGFVEIGATQVSAAVAVGLNKDQFAAARKRSSPFDALVLDALQAARRDRANRADAAPVRADPLPSLGREICAIDACGVALAAHRRCPDCGQLSGPGHQLLALAPGALCPDCYESARRRAAMGIGPRPVDWRGEPFPAPSRTEPAYA